MEYLDEIKNAIRANFGCESAHVRTTHCHHMTAGQTAWKGDVEEYLLANHPTANTCYAWGVTDGKGWEITTVLGVPPVVSADTAVMAYILKIAKQG